MSQIGAGFSISGLGLISTAFSPTSLPGFIDAYKLTPGSSGLWQDSARTTAATVATDPVGCVDGLSGVSARRIIQATSANRPALSSNGLTFDGTNDNLFAASFGYGSVSGLTIVFRMALLSSNAFGGYAAISDGSANDQTHLAMYQNVVMTAFDYIGVVAGGNGGSDLMTSSRAFGAFATVTLTITSGGLRSLYVNGTAEGTENASTAITANKFGIGGRIQSGTMGSYCTNMEISGLIFCDGVLGSSDRALAEAWV